MHTPIDVKGRLRIRHPDADIATSGYVEKAAEACAGADGKRVRRIRADAKGAGGTDDHESAVACAQHQVVVGDAVEALHLRPRAVYGERQS